MRLVGGRKRNAGLCLQRDGGFDWKYHFHTHTLSLSQSNIHALYTLHTRKYSHTRISTSEYLPTTAQMDFSSLPLSYSLPLSCSRSISLTISTLYLFPPFSISFSKFPSSFLCCSLSLTHPHSFSLYLFPHLPSLFLPFFVLRT